MPLRFAYICDLLDDLEALENLSVPLTRKEKFARYADNLTRWFNSHRPTFESPDTDLTALLSCLLPERRSDRVFGMQHERLGNVISGALGLGASGVARLKTIEDGTEFARTVALMVEERTGGTPSSLAMEEVDSTLNQLAAICRFSSPQIRQARDPQGPGHQRDILQPMLRRCIGREVKWVLRIIFKRLGTLCLDERMVLRHIHPILPAIMQVHSDFAAALAILRTPDISNQMRDMAVQSDFSREALHTILKPQTGIKVGRPNFLKVRSLKHCLQLVGSDSWHVMPKYDGEYCQIHVERTNDIADRIQLFSKSGKDSTSDRVGLHHIIRASLGLGKRPRFSKRCILEGEMVVFDTRDASILPFHKIRKHVSRSGSFLGATQNSAVRAYEKLGLVLYDLLLVDDDPIMHQSFRVRLDKLRHLVREVHSQILTASISIIPFAKLQHNPERAERHMIRLFSKVIAQKHEGLILKPEHGSYLSLHRTKRGHHDGQVIKIKTDYFASLGDTADFAVVGASYQDNHKMNLNTLRHVKWTHFTIACLVNKEEVLRYEARPQLKTLDVLSDGFVPERDKAYISQHGQYVEQMGSGSLPFDLQFTAPTHRPKVLFTKPFIVDVLGGSFDRPPSARHYVLRHARIRKVQMDRGLGDIISFDELQNLAEHALYGREDERHEEKRWAELLRQAGKSKKMEYVTRISPTSAPSITGSTRLSSSSCSKLQLQARGSADTSPRLHLSLARLASSAPSSPTVRRNRVAPDRTLVRIDSDDIDQDDSHFARTSTFPEPRKRRQGEILSDRAAKRLNGRSFANADNQWEKRREAHTDQENANLDSNLPSALAHISNVSRTRSTASPSNGKPEPNLSRHLHITVSSPTMSTLHAISSPNPLTRRRSYYHLPSHLTLASPFTNYSIISAPCLRGFPLFTEDLLPLFDPARSYYEVLHWSREIQPDIQPLGPVVPESQTDPSLQKAIFLEPVRRLEMLGLINEALEVRLMPKESIEIWDWHILEELVRLSDQEQRGNGNHNKEARLMRFLAGVIRPATEGEIAVVEDFRTPVGIVAMSKALMTIGGLRDNDTDEQSDGVAIAQNVWDTGDITRSDVTNNLLEVLRPAEQSNCDSEDF